MFDVSGWSSEGGTEAWLLSAQDVGLTANVCGKA
jgi:hypothetical protein